MILRTRSGDVALRDTTLGQDMRAAGYASRSSTGTVVNASNVAGLPAWKQAVRIAAEAIAKHPMRVWRGEEGDRRQIATTWQARFFKGQPNERYSWFYAWECTEASLTARSNAYWLKAGFDTGVSRAVYVLHPDLVNVRWNRELRRVEYRVLLEPERWSDWLTSADVLHFRIGHCSPSSLVASSPIEEHRTALGAALAKTDAETAFY